MNARLNNAGLGLSVLVALGFVAVAVVRAQPTAVGRASDFTSVEYFDAPNQQQMKTRLTGAEALPQADGLLVVKQLRLERFKEDGTLEMVVEAPECLCDTVKGVANSPGPLQVRSGDGKFHVAGVGFLWRQGDSFLTISNQVHTVIETGLMGNTGT